MVGGSNPNVVQRFFILTFSKTMPLDQNVRTHFTTQYIDFSLIVLVLSTQFLQFICNRSIKTSQPTLRINNQQIVKLLNMTVCSIQLIFRLLICYGKQRPIEQSQSTAIAESIKIKLLTKASTIFTCCTVLYIHYKQKHTHQKKNNFPHQCLCDMYFDVSKGIK